MDDYEHKCQNGVDWVFFFLDSEEQIAPRLIQEKKKGKILLYKAKEYKEESDKKIVQKYVNINSKI